MQRSSGGEADVEYLGVEPALEMREDDEFGGPVVGMVRVASIAVLFFLAWSIQIVALPSLLMKWCDGDAAKASTAAGTGLSMFHAFQFVCGAFWGRVSDRHGRRVVVLIGLAAEVTTNALLVVRPAVSTYYVTTVVTGATNLAAAALYGMTYDVCSDKRVLAQHFAVFGASFGFALVVGPGLGGVLFEVAW